MVVNGSGKAISLGFFRLRIPVTSTVRQVSFFIASAGFTQGPPVELQPGADAMANSIPRESA